MTTRSNDNPRPSMSEADVTAQLKREAKQTSPEFSEMLHARVMKRIAAIEPSATTSPRAARITPWLVAAAAFFLIAFGVAWMLNRGTPQTVGPSKEIAKVTNPAAPFAPLIASGVEARHKLEDELSQSRLAYLDRDTQKLAKFVANQLSLGLDTTATPQAQ